MVVTGFDPVVARKHGFRIRKSATGAPSLYAAGPRHLEPLDTVGGSCGSSYVYIYPWEDVGYFITTGFRVKRKAVS
jgi:hypothetical protein